MNIHNITISRTYSTDLSTILNLFKDNSVFKLTGANKIESVFKNGGQFCLTFYYRGTIHGQFTKITENEIVLEWNVDGFQRLTENKTIVEIFIKQEDEKCILTLNHKNIPSGESADAKRKAWTEILNDLETQFINT